MHILQGFFIHELQILDGNFMHKLQIIRGCFMHNLYKSLNIKLLIISHKIHII